MTGAVGDRGAREGVEVGSDLISLPALAEDTDEERARSRRQRPRELGLMCGY